MAAATLAGAERVRMRPTTLGRYLLYRPDGTFLSAQGSGGMAPASQPGPAADWQVQEADGDTFTLAAGEARLTVRFTPAEGCAQFPEAELGASGTPARGEVPYGQVAGLVEGHMHWMTYEYLGGRFHCGRPWHPYGIPFALPDCADIEGPSGAAAPVQNFLNYGLPEAPHDTTGWPKLTSWGRDNLTYEGTYWRWIERAWLGGLRLMVMGVNENRFLCNLQANRVTNCNEMDTVRRGMRAIRELQRYVDAQAGGPGKGFFQIVTDPYEARRVINEGRMAVVLEVEISEPFDCRGWETSTCDTAQVDRQLAELHDLGVRSMLLLNKVDNPLTGVRFDGGPIGTLINVANRLSSGSFWSARTCTGKLRDNEIFGPPGGAELDFALGLARHPERQPADLPAAAALQHARADSARPPRRRPDDRPRHDRQSRSHEPGRGRRHADAAGVAPLLGRHLAARMDGPGQLAAPVEARWRRLPRPQRGGRVHEGMAALPPAQHAVLLRLGLRRRPRRPVGPAVAQRRRQRRVSVQELRRPGHLRAPADRRADLRLCA